VNRAIPCQRFVRTFARPTIARRAVNHNYHCCFYLHRGNSLGSPDHCKQRDAAGARGRGRAASGGRGSDRERGGRRWRGGGDEGNLQGELEPLSSCESWVRGTEVSSSDRRACGIDITNNCRPERLSQESVHSKLFTDVADKLWRGERWTPLVLYSRLEEEKATCSCYRHHVERRLWVRNFARCFGDFGNSWEGLVFSVFSVEYVHPMMRSRIMFLKRFAHHALA